VPGTDIATSSIAARQHRQAEMIDGGPVTSVIATAAGAAVVLFA
jgi:hypothetical protein